jgi:ATP-dependent Clp protease ATP-binding subunit ClpA
MLTDPNTRVIGATTEHEYRSFLASDRAFLRRFSLVHIPSMTRAETKSLLEFQRRLLERKYGVHIPEKALDTVISLTEQDQPTASFPDKAISFLDKLCSSLRTSLKDKNPTNSILQRIDRLDSIVRLETEEGKKTTLESEKQNVKKQGKELQAEFYEQKKVEEN